MKSIAIIYGSSTDNTKEAAKLIAAQLSEFNPTVIDVNEASADTFLDHEGLILGASTWGLGDLQDDWDSFFSDFEALDLSGKVIALFGMGDSSSYSDTYVDAMGTIYEAIEGKGCTIVGAVDAGEYTFDSSKAVKGDKFVGLALDTENEGDLTADRITKWVAAIKPAFS